MTPQEFVDALHEIRKGTPITRDIHRGFSDRQHAIDRLVHRLSDEDFKKILACRPSALGLCLSVHMYDYLIRCFKANIEWRHIHLEDQTAW